MGKFLKFEKMMTPIIIQLIFWIGFIAAIIAGIITMIGGLTGDGGFGSVLIGLVILVVGPIVVRIYCEVLMVAFKILGLLVDIRDKLPDEGSTLSPPPPPTPAPLPASQQPMSQASMPTPEPIQTPAPQQSRQQAPPQQPRQQAPTQQPRQQAPQQQPTRQPPPKQPRRQAPPPHPPQQPQPPT